MKTPLYSLHRTLGAKFINFAGWDMPTFYSSVKDEVLAVRNSCGLFDVSHMGRLTLEGKGAAECLEYLTTNSIKKLYPGRVQYNLLVNERGGVVDDMTVYMLDEERFMLCVNAVNTQKVKDWIYRYHAVEDISNKTVQIALQGKMSQSLISKLFPVDGLKYYHFKVFDSVIVSRTGYTGEDGFEIYAKLEDGIEVFKKLIAKAKPCGLASRDVLRIEAGFALYGHEISEEITPAEAGLDRFISFEKDFLGKEAILSKEVKRKLFGLELLERGIPREGYRIYLSGKEIGYVSSGTYSYTLEKGIALCFVDINLRKENLEVEMEVRGKRLRALLRSYPFLRKP